MNIKNIINDRFRRWRTHLLKNSATPQITIGIGHRGRNKGQIVVCCVEDLSDEEIAALLLGVAEKFAKKEYQKPKL